MGVDLHAGKTRKVRPTMNVTPLVDVCLVLLIIFMVVTPMMVRQFKVHIPKDDKAEDKADKPEPSDDDEVPVVLEVTAAGHATINKEPVADAKLQQKLARIFAARADNTLFFDAADNVPYWRAMEILDLARSGGAAKIAVLTKAVAN